MADFTITIKGGQEFQKTIDGISSRVSRGGVLKLMGATIQRDAVKTFRDQADPKTGRKWKAASELTKRWKGDGKLLQDTGRLLNSLTSQQPEYSSDSVTISTRGVKYAKIHQLGGTIKAKNGRKIAIPLNAKARRAGASSYSGSDRSKNFVFVNRVKIPARPFLGVGKRLMTSLRQNISNYIMRGQQ